MVKAEKANYVPEVELRGGHDHIAESIPDFCR